MNQLLVQKFSVMFVMYGAKNSKWGLIIFYIARGHVLSIIERNMGICVFP